MWHPSQMVLADLSMEETAGVPAQTSRIPSDSAAINQLTSRIGFGVTKGPVNLEAPAIASLQAGFYGHWIVETAPYRPNDMAYIQMVSMHQRLNCAEDAVDPSDRSQCPYAEPYAVDYRTSRSAIVEAAQANPGSLWALGNEIDRIGQDEMLPESYAEAYHELYHWIKEADPTAHIANAGLVQPTPLRLQYLDQIWNAYQNLYGHEMPVDVWNVHNFILSERRYDYGAGIPPGIAADEGIVYPSDMDHVNIEIFKQQIRDFRTWMKDHGQQEKPLIISEYGVLYWHCTAWTDPEQTECSQNLYDDQLVQDFMLDTFDFFLNTKDCDLGYSADECRLVQRWMWYALNNDGTINFNPYTHLYNHDNQSLSDLGVAFQSYVTENQEALQFDDSIVPLGITESQSSMKLFLPYIVR